MIDPAPETTPPAVETTTKTTTTTTPAAVPETKNSTYSNAKTEELLARTGYPLEVTATCRAYGGPPPDYTGDEPTCTSQIFIGRLPTDMKEDELVPIFEKIGKIYVLRIIMERDMPDTNRGFAFLYYTTPEEAELAIDQLDNHEIRPGVYLKVCKSDGNRRLYMGNIHKEKSEEELKAELSSLFPGVEKVTIQADTVKNAKNRGYMFVEFVDHKMAVDAKKACSSNKKILFGRWLRNVDWAESQHTPTETELNTIKTLHVAQLPEGTTEDQIREHFASFASAIDEVQVVREFAFVHFKTREDAEKALNEVEKVIGGTAIKIQFANPRSAAKKKRKPRIGGNIRNPGDPPQYPDFDSFKGDRTKSDQQSAAAAGAALWMSKKRRTNNPNDPSWFDPSFSDQVGSNSVGSWW